MNERIFCCTEGAAFKFWAVALDGATQMVRFGRIGTDGQERTRTFAGVALAQDDTDRRIAQKCAKGYRETTDEALAALLPERPRPRPRRWQQLLLPFDDDAPSLELSPESALALEL